MILEYEIRKQALQELYANTRMSWTEYQIRLAALKKVYEKNDD